MTTSSHAPVDRSPKHYLLGPKKESYVPGADVKIHALGCVGILNDLCAYLSIPPQALQVRTRFGLTFLNDSAEAADDYLHVRGTRRLDAETYASLRKKVAGRRARLESRFLGEPVLVRTTETETAQPDFVYEGKLHDWSKALEMPWAKKLVESDKGVQQSIDAAVQAYTRRKGQTTPLHQKVEISLTPRLFVKDGHLTTPNSSGKGHDTLTQRRLLVPFVDVTASLRY